MKTQEEREEFMRRGMGKIYGTLRFGNSQDTGLHHMYEKYGALKKKVAKDVVKKKSLEKLGGKIAKQEDDLRILGELIITGISERLSTYPPSNPQGASEHV